MAITLLGLFSFSYSAIQLEAMAMTSLARNLKNANLLAHTSTILQISKEVSAITPIPLLPSILGALQEIVDDVRQVQDDRDRCAALERRARTIASNLTELVQENAERIPGDALSKNLAQFHESLQHIQRTMATLSSRKFHQRLLHRSKTSQRLLELQMELSDAWQTFNSSALIAIQQTQAEQRLFDGEKSAAAATALQNGRKQY
ncbi:hypothetical protein OH77DRAFT_1519578 [Trametes cingulata]|nr:hypothetical protein OH77DRAFT_1519578 [Trametes cingulata]